MSWGYVDVELAQHVNMKLPDPPVIQQIIDAYVETLAHQLRIVRMPERHVFQEHVCVELMHRVLEAHRSQPVTL